MAMMALAALLAACRSPAEIRQQQVLEDRAYCAQIGMGPGTDRHGECMLRAAELRIRADAVAAQEKRARAAFLDAILPRACPGNGARICY